MSLTKNSIVTVDIIDLTFEGLGVAKHDGMAVFVHGALQGEKIKAKILSVKKRHAFARVEEILVASVTRAKPACRYFPKCGGCSLQHMHYTAELEVKKTWIARTLEKKGVVWDTPYLKSPFKIVASNLEYRCRNKCSLPIREAKDGSVAVGFFRKKSHEVIDIDDCLLQMGNMRDLVFTLKAWLNGEVDGEKRTDKDDKTSRHKEVNVGRKILAYNEEKHTGNVRHITLRMLDNRAVICLVGTQTPHAIDFKPFIERLGALYPSGFMLYYNQNPVKTNVIYGDSYTLIAGDDTPFNVDGLQLNVHPAGFFQVNDYVRQKMFEVVKEWVEEIGAHTVIEAYAGQAVLAAKLSGLAKKVYAIEICPQSIHAGNEMKQLNSIDNIEFIQGDCGIELAKLLKRLADEPLVILDPPRSGLCEKARSAVATARPTNIMYISCNPDSLARDIASFGTGYATVHMRAFDMFPKTLNVETLVWLQKTD